MRSTPISPGRLTSLSRLLEFVRGNEGSSVHPTLAHLVSQRQLPNETLAKEALWLGTELRLLEIVDNRLLIAEMGRRLAVQSKGFTDIQTKRRLLLLLIKSLRRDLLWISLVDTKELNAVEDGLFQTLKELGLVAREMSPEANEFWTSLRNAGGALDAAMKKRIGDEAEEWSVSHENERLISLGHSALAEKIQWISRASDIYGYDILSYQGTEPAPAAPLHIEVKRVSRSSPERFAFFLSRNEYNQARVLGRNYVFHLWSRHLETSQPQLLIVDARKVLRLAPSDNVAGGYWSECKITLPISTTSEKDTLTKVEFLR